MTHPVVRKLEFFWPLPDEDKALVEAAISSAKDVAADVELIREGDDPNVVHLMISGFACRYKLLADGKRPIVAFLIPGDFADPYVFILKSMDHSIATLAPSQVAEVSQQAIIEMMSRPALARALFMAALADSSTLREWIATIGQRSGERRIAHLFCEITARLRAVGLITDGIVRLPINQTQLSDAVGLSLVHTNKCLRILRDRNLIRFASGNLEIIDPARLEEFCGFKSNYLHLTRKPALEPDTQISH